MCWRNAGGRDLKHTDEADLRQEQMGDGAVNTLTASWNCCRSSMSGTSTSRPPVRTCTGNGSGQTGIGLSRTFNCCWNAMPVSACVARSFPACRIPRSTLADCRIWRTADALKRSNACLTMRPASRNTGTWAFLFLYSPKDQERQTEAPYRSTTTRIRPPGSGRTSPCSTASPSTVICRTPLFRPSGFRTSMCNSHPRN